MVVYQNVLMPGGDWDSYQVFGEEFVKDRLCTAVDAFMRETIIMQSWIEVAESRAKLIPADKAAFECPFCGWVTDSEDDDSTCLAAGNGFGAKRCGKGLGQSEPKIKGRSLSYYRYDLDII